MLKRPKVAVIGGGALGLMALKQFQEDGFDAVGFEARPYIGGLWKDTDDDTISVHANTIFNTSKFRAAISDFPFSEDTDVYPTAAQMHRYLNNYADHFGIREKIHVGNRVRHIVRRDSEDDWEIQVRHIDSEKETTYYFDRVCVATGSFFSPRWPKLAGIEKFEGKVLHSIDFHGSEPFRGQNVLIIGLHATAQDVTNLLSESARKVYLSHRRGVRFLPRFNDGGAPIDVTVKLPTLMFQTFMESRLPAVWTWLLNRLTDSMSKKAFPDIPDSWDLRPAPSMAVTTPLMADTIWPHLKSGFAEPVPTVEKITGLKTVMLTNGRVLEDIDTILYCTGYDISIPKDLIPRPADAAHATSYDPYPNGPGYNPYLYNNIFPLSPDPKIQTSLTFLGQSATNYPGFVQFELQAMAISQIWRGKHSLPSYEEMLNWHQKHTSQREATALKHDVPKDSTFYTLGMPFGYMLPWLDKMAGTGIYETFGGKLGGLFNIQAWRLWWEDRELYDLCTKGVLSPAVFRAIATGGRKALGREEVKRILQTDNKILEKAVAMKKAELELAKNKIKTL
ncbi:putative Flavin-containing monooxygenase-like protein [Seiridium cardinale]